MTPGAANPTHTLSVNVHKSHAPTVCAGDTQPLNQADCRGDPASCPKPVPGPATLRIDPTSCPGFAPTKNYHLSVLPWHTDTGDGWMMSGRNIAAGQQSVQVIVHRYARPTAQVTIIVFEDNQPIKRRNDQPAELGLSEFTLVSLRSAGPGAAGRLRLPARHHLQVRLHARRRSRPCSIDADRATSPRAPRGATRVPVRSPTGLPVVDFLGDGTHPHLPGPARASGTDGYTAYQLANCVDPYSRTPLDRGEAVVRYLPMNKYAIEPVPSLAGVDCGATAPRTSTDCSDMLLTATLEGTRGNDAWVRAGEPRYNITLGQLNWLVFYGFVHPMNTLAVSPGPYTGPLTGQVVYVHDEHPPFLAGADAPVFRSPTALSGSTTCPATTSRCTRRRATPTAPSTSAASRRAPISSSCGTSQSTPSSTSARSPSPPRQTSRPGRRAGLQLVRDRLTGHVFYDPNGDGLPADGVPVDPDCNQGIPNVPINLHFTDGSMIQTTVTDSLRSFLLRSVLRLVALPGRSRSTPDSASPPG